MNETTTRTPQEKVCGYEYTVRRGDSFYLIAHRLGVPLRDLLAANADVNPARLMVGDVLCIPMEEDDVPVPEAQQPAVETPEEAAPETLPDAVPVPEVIVEQVTEEPLDGEAIIPELMPEDSLDMPAAGVTDSRCAGARYTVSEGETAADIQMDLNLSLNTLQTANPDVRLDQLAAGDVLCIPEENIPCPVADTYAIQTGETLESVALRLNVSLGALLRANPCLAPSDFAEGMCVIVPG